ncbi:hypothetical protein Tco_1186845, partial [Tanacetum coccineum]
FYNEMARLNQSNQVILVAHSHENATSEQEKHKGEVGFALGSIREVTQCHIKGMTRWKSLVTQNDQMAHICDPVIGKLIG